MRLDDVEVTTQHTCPRTGRALRTVKSKRSCIAYCVDESDRRVLAIGKEKHAVEYPVSGGVQILTQFVTNGKATLILLKRNINILLSCPDSDSLKRWCDALKAGSAAARNELKGTTGGDELAKRSLSEVSSRAHCHTGAEGNGRAPLSSVSPSKLNSPKARLASKKFRDYTRQSPSWTSPPPASASVARSQAFTPEQYAVIEHVAQGRSVFFTGGAGVGKTFLLRELVSRLPQATTYVTATTGMAACQAGGVTIHHWAGIGAGDRPIDELVKMARNKRGVQWRDATSLVIDEISMLDGRMFDKLEEVARRIRGDSRPFGGLQLVLCGDFFQLPPVARDGNFKFAFEAESWHAAIGSTFELTQVFRQSDILFIDALREVRLGKASANTRVLLDDRLRRQLPTDDGISATTLFTHKAECTALNEKKLKELSGQLYTFAARDTAADESTLAVLRSGCAAPASLSLKVGAQVVLTKTIDSQAGLVNGARGVVLRILTTKNPVVRFASGGERIIRMETFPLMQGGKVVASRSQMPLMLGWGLSIHRSQGMTLDRVQMSLANVFECGQMYVALSRARSLDGLSINDINWNKLRAHPKVLAWRDKLVSQGLLCQHA